MSEEYGQDRDEKGKFQPGNKVAKNRGANHVSTKVKESIVNFLEENIDAIQESFDELKPKDKLEFIASIIPYAAPKLSSTQIDQVTDGKVEVIVRYEKRDNPA